MFDLFDLSNCIFPLLVHQNFFFVFLLSPACAHQPWRFGHPLAELAPHSITQSWKPRQNQIRESQNHRMGWVGRGPKDHQQEKTYKVTKSKHDPSTAVPTTVDSLCSKEPPHGPPPCAWAALPRMCSEFLKKGTLQKLSLKKNPKHIVPLLPVLERTAAVWSHGLKLFQI